MPFGNGERMMTVLLVLALIFILPMDGLSDRFRGRRHLDDIFIIILVVLGVSAYFDYCPDPYGYYYYYY